jgi:spore coat protein CotH
MNMLRSISLIRILPAIFISAFVAKINAQQDFYEINTIQQIEISFTQSNWDYRMDTAKAGSGSYLMAQWVKVNGIQFDSAGVKYKGTSSYDPTYIKNPLHISLDEFKAQSYQGFASIKLSNDYGDPSMIREALSYSILDKYMDCSRSNFAKVYINGVYIGLYTNDESVNKKFCSDHFYSSSNTFIKGNPLVAGPYSKSNLKYISADSSAYFGKYEIESDYGWSDLEELCDVITNVPSALSATLDIDRALWMLAFNNVLVNLDSYSGWFSQNHYLYKDNTGHFNPVIWDLNMSFGGFPFAGTQGGGSGSLTVEGMQQMDHFLHFSENDWPLIYVILSNPKWRSMYIAHMRTIIDENFSNGSYQEKALQLQSLIDGAVQTDPNKFFTYEQFQEGLTTDVQFGSYVVPGIGNLMEARTPYLLSTTELSTEPPQISNVQPGNPEPLPGEEVTVTALVTGQDELEVYLGIRFDKEDKFQQENMYDDGNHNDGIAGDNIYGASFIMSSLIAHYYIYAETTGIGLFAGMFSPEHAEHEFYTLAADIPTAQPGEVAINEFLAKNTADTANEYGNYEDWIELYNLTDEPLDLFGLYLSDDYTNPAKFAFPESTTIQAGGFLTIWADEEDTLSNFLHANFKLSANGESLMLSDRAGLVLDSLTFGPQTADVSFGRCPDGNGPFISFLTTTFNDANDCPEQVNDVVQDLIHADVFPNPARDFIVIVSDDVRVYSAEITNMSGKSLLTEKFDHGIAQIRTFTMPSGLYLYRILDKNGCALLRGKFSVVK